MNTFKRTIEKVLAWIANVILILITILFAILKFTGAFDAIWQDNAFKDALKASLMQEGVYTNEAEFNSIINVVAGIMSGYTIFLIILVIVALVATFAMGSRILSGVLFLLVALLTLVGSLGGAFFLYIPYLIVAIMLFVRKPPVDLPNFNNPDNQQVDRVEYI